MDSEDFDHLIKLFDYALSSDNPAVKKALKNLLLVVSIVEPQEEATGMSPLKEIKLELQKLRTEVAMLQQLNRSGAYIPPYNPNTTSYPLPFPGSYPSTNPWTSYDPRNGIVRATSSVTSGSISSMPGSFTTNTVSTSSLNSELLARIVSENELNAYFDSMEDQETERKE